MSNSVVGPAIFFARARRQTFNQRDFRNQDS